VRRTPNLISLVLVVVLAGLLFGACRAGPDEAGDADASVPALDGSTTSEAPPSTTTTSEPASPPSTVYAPDTIEGRIEADYLAAWDAYAEALAVPDASLLEPHFSGEALALVTRDVHQLLADGQAVNVWVEHDYDISNLSSEIGGVQDAFVNHMRLIDPRTGAYQEPDPNARLGRAYTLTLENGLWSISNIVSVPL